MGSAQLLALAGPLIVNERQNHPAAASDIAKREKRTTAARVHFIVIL